MTYGSLASLLKARGILIYYALVIVGLIVHVSASIMPWMSAKQSIIFSLSLSDFYRLAPHYLLSGLPGFGLLLPSILYPISIVLALVSIRIKKISLIAGLVDMAFGVLWIIVVDVEPWSSHFVFGTSV